MSRKFSKGLLVLSGVLALGAVGLASCGETRPAETESIYNSITITNKSAFESLVAEGKAVDLELVVDPEANIPELLMQDKIQITSDHPEIAKAEGITITPLAEGTATITVKLETRTDTVTVTVAPKPVQEKLTIAKIIENYSKEVFDDVKDEDRTRFSFEAVLVGNTKNRDIVLFDGTDYINGYSKENEYKDLKLGTQYLIENAYLADNFGQFQIKERATFTEVTKTIKEDTKKEYGEAELAAYEKAASKEKFATVEDYYTADAATIKNAVFDSKYDKFGCTFYTFYVGEHKIVAENPYDSNWPTVKKDDICTLNGVIKGFNSDPNNTKIYFFGDSDLTITGKAEAKKYDVTLPDGVTADKSTGLVEGTEVTLTYTGDKEVYFNGKKVTKEADGTYKIIVAKENVVELRDSVKLTGTEVVIPMAKDQGTLAADKHTLTVEKNGVKFVYTCGDQNISNSYDNIRLYQGGQIVFTMADGSNINGVKITTTEGPLDKVVAVGDENFKTDITDKVVSVVAGTPAASFTIKHSGGKKIQITSISVFHA